MKHFTENRISKWRSLNCRLTGVFRKQVCFIHSGESEHTHGCQVDKRSVTHLVDVSILHKREALIRRSRLFISGNPVVFICCQIKPCPSLYIMLHSLYFRNLHVSTPFERCSYIQIKHGPLLHTCHNIDTVRRNVHRRIEHSTNVHAFKFL